ncbi:MAG: serine hydrolase domain-containing protein [Gemmatimonadaceae bacterium]
MRWTSFGSILLALTAATPAVAQLPDRAAVVARIDSLAESFLATTHTPGISLAVLQASDTLVMKGYGFADNDTRRRATSSTVYRIGSITKQFTSSAIMRLVEHGRLSLEDDVSKYLPEVPLHGQRVTVRELLNHTSGIHSYTSKKEWVAHWADDLTPRQIVAFVDNDTLDFMPGTRFLYNNTGYVLLGMLIEKVTGESYARYLQHDLLTPLSLAQTSYCPSHVTDTTFAAGYATDSNGVKPPQYVSMTQPFAAGALCSTVRDVVRWQRSLAGGRVVNASSYRLMTTSDTVASGKPTGYGFGLATGTLETKPWIGHTGSIHGFTAATLYLPEDGVDVVVLSNADAGPNPLALNIARTVLGLPLAKPKPFKSF